MLSFPTGVSDFTTVNAKITFPKIPEYELFM